MYSILILLAGIVAIIIAGYITCLFDNKNTLICSHSSSQFLEKLNQKLKNHNINAFIKSPEKPLFSLHVNDPRDFKRAIKILDAE